MKYLETILTFLTSLAWIIFPRKQKPTAGDCPCPHPYPRPLPDGDHPAVSSDGTDGSDADSYRSDTLALNQGDRGTKQRVEPIDIAGYSLMAAGLIGGLYKLFTA
ncbi:hypothetical protein H8788_07360 [Parabacteroides faecis]|uniref:hypothetical protein n=1 Tax=Parabacteroides TaxID=375288 RepID=UPI000F00D421|nr:MULTISPECIES: hypothetical protein [Parabacteroides]MBC8617549.1 hypothetical protein [Parabacteroides faecis]RHR99574.1 hypothetical protein DWW23_06610 [Parabacteroides sp. AF14-59]